MHVARKKLLSLTSFSVYATLKLGDTMTENGLQFYDSDLDYYFVVKVTLSGEAFYAYNYRTLVRSIQSARFFDTRRSARRCILRGGFAGSEILKVPRPHLGERESKTAD